MNGAPQQHLNPSTSSSVFEPGLLTELETRSMLMNVSGGETMLNPGQTIRAVPLVVSGTFKVSRINDEGQELLLYYVKEGESCAMSFTCCMMCLLYTSDAADERSSVDLGG